MARQSSSRESTTSRSSASERLQDGEKLVFGEREELVLLFRDDGKVVRIAWPVRRAFEQAVAVLIIETHAPKTETGRREESDASNRN